MRFVSIDEAVPHDSEKYPAESLSNAYFLPFFM